MYIHRYSSIWMKSLSFAKYINRNCVYVCMLLYLCMYAKQFLLINKLSVFASLFCVCLCMYGVSARMIRHLKFLHRNPDVMIHIRAYEEYDGDQEYYGEKSYRDGVYIQYIHTYIHVFPHTNIHKYIHTYLHSYAHIYTHSYIHSTYIYTQKQACIHVFMHTYTQRQTCIHTFICMDTCT